MRRSGQLGKAVRLVPFFILLLLGAMFLAGCGGQDRYSDDPAAERIQRLTDFCIGYGALRDAATTFIEVDVARDTPVLTVDTIMAYGAAREFIRPFCAPEFDPQNELFSLEALNEQLKAIRLVLLEKENQ
jgi:hypothetical protein